MKLELTVGVYIDDDIVDTVSYVVPAEPLARILDRILDPNPEDSVNVSVNLEGVKELYE